MPSCLHKVRRKVSVCDFINKKGGLLAALFIGVIANNPHRHREGRSPVAIQRQKRPIETLAESSGDGLPRSLQSLAMTEKREGWGNTLSTVIARLDREGDQGRSVAKAPSDVAIQRQKRPIETLAESSGDGLPRSLQSLAMTVEPVSNKIDFFHNPYPSFRPSGTP